MKNKRVLAALLAVLTAALCAGVSPVSAEVDLIDILCVGESLTCGSGANENGTITEPKLDADGNPVLDDSGNVVMVNSKINAAMTYPARLYSKLGYGYNVYNYGISGVSVLPEYKWTWASGGYLVAAQSSSSANPFSSSAPTTDIIFLMLGTNDAKDRIWKTDKGTGGAENFYEYYTNIIKAFRALPTNPQIVCVVPPPVVNAEGINDYEIVEETLRDEITPIIERVAREQKCLYLNLRNVFPDPVTNREELLALYAVDDGVHPNKDGYNLIAEAMLPYAKRVQGDANASGAFNDSDLVDYAKYLAGWAGIECSELNADVNLDGKASSTDLAMMAKKLADWEVTFY